MSWNRNRSYQETLEILRTLSFRCSELGGPVSKAIYSLVDQGLFIDVLNYKLDYVQIETNDAVYARQIQGFFQKWEELNLGIDKESVAASRFLESESMCLETNRTLAYHRRKPMLRPPAVDVVFHYAQRKIDRILGDVPSLDDLDIQFGPGANTSVKAAVACPRAKLSAVLECSNEMSPTVSEFLYEVPEWAISKSVSESEDSFIVPVDVAPGKLMFVPKNAKTYRSIVIEPILNSLFQKGVGSYMKKRLMRSGVDLTDQTINQRLARRGSIDDSLCTVDLSMASDCLSYELVHELLTPDWCDLLGRLRTGSVVLPKSAIEAIRLLGNAQFTPYEDGNRSILRLEKFSSMGNAFTFELESLIFYSLVYGVCRSLHLPTSDISVFGDDLIVPKAAYSRLTTILEYCGFSVNLEKSFSSGPFRESCGADYLKGFDIRPYYQKSLISDRTLFSMHNWFVRHGEYQLAEVVRTFLTPATILYGPDGFGDGHLIGSYVLRRNRSVERAGWGGGFFDTYVLKERRFTKPLPGDAILPVYSVYTRSGAESPTDPDVVRGCNGYAKISIYTLVENIFHV